MKNVRKMKVLWWENRGLALRFGDQYESDRVSREVSPKMFGIELSNRLYIMKEFFEYALKKGAVFLRHLDFFEMIRKEKEQIEYSLC